MSIAASAKHGEQWIKQKTAISCFDTVSGIDRVLATDLDTDR